MSTYTANTCPKCGMKLIETKSESKLINGKWVIVRGGSLDCPKGHYSTSR